MALLRRIVDGARIVFTKENLPLEDHGPSATGAVREGFLLWLLKPEALERDLPEMPARQNRSVAGWLFGKETLPEDPSQGTGRRGFVRLLLEREELPVEPGHMRRD